MQLMLDLNEADKERSGNTCTEDVLLLWSYLMNSKDGDVTRSHKWFISASDADNLE